MQTNPKKRILFVITKSNLGGAQRYVYELATALPRETYDVAVAFGGTGLLKEKLEAAGIRTFAIPSFDRDINIIKELRALFELRALIRDWQPDIVHLNSSKAGGTGALIARLMGVPHIIFTAHGWAFNEPRNFFWRSIVWLLSWFTALCAHTIILVSAYDRARTHMPFVHNKCAVIRTGLSPFTLKTRAEARTALYRREIEHAHAHDFWLVTTAELTPNKNILTALAAVAAYNATHTEKIFYTIMGDGELRHEIETYISTHELAHSVHLAGYVEDARTYLKAFDAFLLPSHKEGLPYAILEAGYGGLPVIASNVGGIPEIINDETGILINPREIESIIHAFELLTRTTPRDLPLSHLLGEALQKKVLAEYTLDRMFKETEKIYSRPTTK